MLFNSLQFLVFFPVVVLAYYVMPAKLKNVWLLLASYYFYMCWSAKYALLMLVSTVVTWGFALLTARAGSLRAKKWCVAGSFIINLAILFFFKYYNFAAGSLAALAGRLGVAFTPPHFSVLLPVGISFYTFQALGYTVDVYRGLKPEKNFLDYALFVSFFPQLVAGPIERTANLLPQIKRVRSFDYLEARRGLLQMLWGLFQKLVIADRVAMLADTVFTKFIYFLYHAIKEISIVAHDDDRAIEVGDGLLEDIFGEHVQVVGRLIEDEQVDWLKQ